MLHFLGPMFSLIVSAFDQRLDLQSEEQQDWAKLREPLRFQSQKLKYTPRPDVFRVPHPLGYELLPDSDAARLATMGCDPIGHCLDTVQRLLSIFLKQE